MLYKITVSKVYSIGFSEARGPEEEQGPDSFKQFKINSLPRLGNKAIATSPFLQLVFVCDKRCLLAWVDEGGKLWYHQARSLP